MLQGSRQAGGKAGKQAEQAKPTNKQRNQAEQASDCHVKESSPKSKEESNKTGKHPGSAVRHMLASKQQVMYCCVCVSVCVSYYV